MKLKIKDNKTWVEQEKKKQRKRIYFLVLSVLFIVAATAGIYIASWMSEKYGNFYPDVLLADAPTQAEPEVYISSNLTEIIKCPSISYTMVMSGQFVGEGSSYCIFADENHYVSVCEITKNADAKQILQEIIVPALNVKSTKADLYKDQNGYLNNRYVETFGCTLTLEKGRLYTFNYRVFLEDEKDLLISVLCAKRNLYDASDNLERIFYTLHQLEDAEKNPAEGTESDIGDIEGITENKNSIDDFGEPMDENKIGDQAYEMTPNNGYSPIEEGKIYKQDCEKTLEITESYEHAYICFAYDINRELDSIVLYDPSGENMYFPEPYDFYKRAEYVFKVDDPEPGEWKFVYSASGEIGYYYAYVFAEEDYVPLRMRGIPKN